MSVENGLFWLPHLPNVTVSGRLIVDSDGATHVELLGSITPEYEVVSHDETTGEFTTVPAKDPADFIIHGLVADTPRAVSLLECRTSRRTTTHAAAGVLEQQTVRAGRLLRGHHLTAADRFTGLRLRVAGIDAWAALPDAIVTRGEDGRLEVVLEPLTVTKVETTCGAELTLNVRSAWRQSGGRTSTERETWIQLTKISERAYRQVDAEYINAILSFLGLAIGKSVPLSAVQVLHGTTWVTVIHPGITDGPATAVTSHDVILPLAYTGLSAVSAFLDVYRLVGPAAPITRDALSNQRKTTIDTQILELTTVAEGLHRRLYPQQERMSKEDAKRIRSLIADALKHETEPRYVDVAKGTVLGFLNEPNYKSRLEHLSNEATTATPGLFGNQQQWIKRVYEARNSFAHRTSGFIDETQIDEMYAISESLTWMFWCLLLLRSKIAPETIRERIAQHQPYQYFLRNARETVPSIYATEPDLIDNVSEAP